MSAEENTLVKPFSLLRSTKVLTFIAIALFYFFESAQMAYFNVLAPTFLHQGIYQHAQIAAVSAAYYYGDMVGLLPVGWALDYFPLRRTLIAALIGSIIGAFLLFASTHFYIQWFARFLCGFFGGTFSFIGGIRVIASVFPKRFTYYMGLFLAAGMFGGMLSQYPLLLTVKEFGITGTMELMFAFGVIVVLFNFVFLHPSEQEPQGHQTLSYQGSFFQLCQEILFNLRNGCDVLMVVLLDTPVSIIGTLWGIVFLAGFFHFNATASSWIVMSLFAGLMTGLPLWGYIADQREYPPWIVVLGAGMSFLICLFMLLFQHQLNIPLVTALFFALGLFSSCQTLGFTWLTKNMRPELIGRHSAFNSMVFMGSNGALKQLGAFLLTLPMLLLQTHSSGYLLLIMTGAMLIAALYALFRKMIFDVVC